MFQINININKYYLFYSVFQRCLISKVIVKVKFTYINLLLILNTTKI